MATPDFILDLRRKIGHDLLWLIGATGIIWRDETRREVLLVQRSDNRLWAPVAGITDPGENPAQTVIREAEEEAGVEVRIDRMLWLEVLEPKTYHNGDQCQYLDHGFSAYWTAGVPRVADDESVAVGWFKPDELPQPQYLRLAQMVAWAQQDARDVALPSEPTAD